MGKTGPPCGCCTHEYRHLIELGLVHHVPVRVLAKRFSLTKDQIFRHRKLHMSPQLKAASAPTAVTGLKPDEVKFLREQFEKSVCPEVAEERPLTLQALDDLDHGARNAINKICQAAGVKAHELVDAAAISDAA